MQNIKMLLFSICTLVLTIRAEVSTQNYRYEFENLKKSDYKAIFNEDTNSNLQSIQRDLENYKHLTYFQRFVRGAFLNLDVIVLSQETMPQLYNYIEQISQKAGIPTPTVFLTTKKGFFNAMAQKLFMSSGAIVIGQKLLLETSDQELEAVIAHEIGHIKYNHINKQVGLYFIGLAAFYLALTLAEKSYSPYTTKDLTIAKAYLSRFLSSITTSFAINKKFEKEADAFAYEAMGKGKGLIEFFENLQQKEICEENDFQVTYDLIQKNSSKINASDKIDLVTRYYMARTGNKLNNFYKWLYYHTPYGAHPSPEARIKTANDFLDSQEKQEVLANA